ncbi:penicillin-binding protein activator [Spiribacter vilamensis]|uniref:Penicillin-binding protein activator n=1 Tax=Spiribacter vilamensis TaxID=531306 RepID=A0A4Q8CY95_9GAMM|nr:penicillin-binding protein activator [Spiribacter vilamensis]RZU97902.1 hypothetical protein EV698_0135 [Spiribacter vilamensis]TVO61184.1 penicillin-binding protein activator [Spiribacter vilamensis]
MSIPRLPTLLLIIGLLVSGCSSLPSRDAQPLETVDGPHIDDAEAALALGDPASAVTLLRMAARNFREPTSTGLRLEAARLALTLDDPTLARAILDVDDVTATADNQAVATLIRTRLDDTLTDEAIIERLETLTAPLSRRMEPYRLQALVAARAGRGDPIGAINAWQSLDREALAPEQRRITEARLWQALYTMPMAELEAAIDSATSVIADRWLKLAVGVREHALDPAATRSFIDDWKRSPSTSDVSAATLERIFAMQRADLSPPRRVAVLLPLSGDLADAGQAVRDGLLAAYYADDADRPALAFFDVGANGMDVISAYREAIAAGAGRIIGPLRKSAVRDLIASTDLRIPVIALNRIESDGTGSGFQQFGLAPENDAVATASLARQLGHERLLIIHRDDDWGQRVASAFETALTAAGGEIVGRQTYPPDQDDLSYPIKALLLIDDSEDRRDRLESLTGRRYGFEARRRRDTDGIFVAAFERDARLVVPQLRFHRGIDLPVFGISDSFPEQPEIGANRDLSGLIFARMPWLLDDPTSAIAADARRQLEAVRSGEPPVRLEGLGVDSYRLLSGIDALTRDPRLTMPGVTGRLSINTEGQVERALQPVRVRSGGLERLAPTDGEAVDAFVP